MKFLFIHQNFPGQFKHLAPALAKRGHELTALSPKQFDRGSWQGVKLLRYEIARQSTPGIHPWLQDFETKTIRGESCFLKALELSRQGYTPDVIIAHHGWGESMFLKQLWPEARLGLYCEFYYHASGADVGFDPEFLDRDPALSCKMQHKNLNNLVHLEQSDACISPTHWQAETFPGEFRDRITVVHDGIDTDALCPNEAIELTLNGELKLNRESEVVTFVNRMLEPYRGYHVFMRALPKLLERRPEAQVLIVGGEGVSYGSRPDRNRFGEKSWKQIFIDEVRPRIKESDWQRVHFLGNIPYPQFIGVLQLSSCHVYLTYPFVLSWSLLEAMSIGCPIVASSTKPVLEAIRDGETGLLVDFFDHAALAERIAEILENPELSRQLSRNARDFAVRNYDLNKVCLPGQLAWVDRLAGTK